MKLSECSPVASCDNLETLYLFFLEQLSCFKRTLCAMYNIHDIVHQHTQHMSYRVKRGSKIVEMTQAQFDVQNAWLERLELSMNQINCSVEKIVNHTTDRAFIQTRWGREHEFPMEVFEQLRPHGKIFLDFCQSSRACTLLDQFQQTYK
jgi:hypothetical protein